MKNLVIEDGKSRCTITEMLGLEGFYRKQVSAVANNNDFTVRSHSVVATDFSESVDTNRLEAFE